MKKNIEIFENLEYSLQFDIFARYVQVKFPEFGEVRHIDFDFVNYKARVIGPWDKDIRLVLSMCIDEALLVSKGVQDSWNQYYLKCKQNIDARLHLLDMLYKCQSGVVK